MNAHAPILVGGHPATPEQANVLAMATSSTDSLVIQAMAGAGKSSVLMAIAESLPRLSFLYVAYNKAIVNDIGDKLPGNCSARTMHSIAFGALGKNYAHRLKGGARMKNTEMAKKLGIDQFTYKADGKIKRLSPGFLASKVMAAVANFTNSAEYELGPSHFPYVDGIDDAVDGKRGWTNNRLLVKELLPAAKKLWADKCNPQGQMPYTHDDYLKAYCLTKPVLDAQVVLCDEMQDANPVWLEMLAQQPASVRLISVGDSQQNIYSYRGSVDALGQLEARGASVAWMTTSFRFGPEIASVANQILALIEGVDARVVGSPFKTSSVGYLDAPDAILCRTNAECVRQAISAMNAGKRVHLVGGADEIIRFCEGVVQLEAEGWTSNPQLACFSSWDDVKVYVQTAEDAADLESLVRLVDSFTPQILINALAGICSERTADVVVSTAHRSKGRQWNKVQLAGDFRSPAKSLSQALDPAELRLLYVAVTRAIEVLDVSMVGLFQWISSTTAVDSQGTPIGTHGIDVTVGETEGTFTAVMSSEEVTESAEGSTPLRALAMLDGRIRVMFRTERAIREPYLAAIRTVAAEYARTN